MVLAMTTNTTTTTGSITIVSSSKPDIFLKKSLSNSSNNGNITTNSKMDSSPTKKSRFRLGSRSNNSNNNNNTQSSSSRKASSSNGMIRNNSQSNNNCNNNNTGTMEEQQQQQGSNSSSSHGSHGNHPANSNKSSNSSKTVNHSKNHSRSSSGGNSKFRKIKKFLPQSPAIRRKNLKNESSTSSLPMPSITTNILCSSTALSETDDSGVEVGIAIPNGSDPTTSKNNNKPSAHQDLVDLLTNSTACHSGAGNATATAAAAAAAAGSLLSWSRQSSNNATSSSSSSTSCEEEGNDLEDGFCRRVSSYDGQTISVNSIPTYEVGNYLGGGVAGVVYEGIRLRPLSEYPHRHLMDDTQPTKTSQDPIISTIACSSYPNQTVPATTATDPSGDNNNHLENGSSAFMRLLCSSTTSPNDSSILLDTSNPQIDDDNNPTQSDKGDVNALDNHQDSKQLSLTPETETAATNLSPAVLKEKEQEDDDKSRSRSHSRSRNSSIYDNPLVAVNDDSKNDEEENENNDDTNETVAIKILNPVGFRLLSSSLMEKTVIVKEGKPLNEKQKTGLEPMTEQNVWWVIHPHSKGLRTLLSSSPNTTNSDSKKVDRGASHRGLRLSLVAAYLDPATTPATTTKQQPQFNNSSNKINTLSELPLNKCVEIWGHAPFDATEQQFEMIMDAIERVNAGQKLTSINNNHSSNNSNDNGLIQAFESSQKRSGLFRATLTAQQQNQKQHISDSHNSNSSLPNNHHQNETDTTASKTKTSSNSPLVQYCASINAYITIPIVPPKYLRWLRQRRAVTKEIRNMMKIGRHKNVVHLYEVMELIQPTKSTMFLVLELVRGGELFDLISNGNNNNNTNKDTANINNKHATNDSLSATESTMRNFFHELSSGIAYCHDNGIAHRDLKPENLLVHQSPNGGMTLKIADFGLSATFAMNSNDSNSNDPTSSSDDLEPSLSFVCGQTASCSPITSSPNLSGMRQKVESLHLNSINNNLFPNNTNPKNNNKNGEGSTYGDRDVVSDGVSFSPTNKVPSTASVEQQQQQQQQSSTSNTASSSSYMSRQIYKFQEMGASAFNFFTCGNMMDQVFDKCCQQRTSDSNNNVIDSDIPLRRMTSIVGSPHYVAPEIISQSSHNNSANANDDINNLNNNSNKHSNASRRRSNESMDVPDFYNAVSNYGYDGTKADVWSAGVILYAMLFRSLPFGEDLLCCPRYQSFYNWYEEARRIGGGRRVKAESSLLPLKPGDDDDEYDLGPHWFFPHPTSMESRDLIVAMLNPDPYHRLSIDQVLIHPWIKTNNNKLQS